jgi:hypothetical protein
MGADAGGLRIGHEDRLAVGMRMPSRSLDLTGLAGAGQCKTRHSSAQIAGSQTRLGQALNRGLVNRSKALRDSKANIRRSGTSFAECRQRGGAKASAASGPTAIHPQQERFRVRKSVHAECSLVS